MRIFRYYPDKLYGFCQGDKGEEFFFHLSAFHPGDSLDDLPIPPILGEPVLVEGDLSNGQGKAPRALSVTRLNPPRLLTGVVDSFDPSRHYGFICGEDGVDYHLHDSEVQEGRMPSKGASVEFYPGLREGRPRACHVKVLR